MYSPIGLTLRVPELGDTIDLDFYSMATTPRFVLPDSSLVRCHAQDSPSHRLACVQPMTPSRFLSEGVRYFDGAASDDVVQGDGDDAESLAPSSSSSSVADSTEWLLCTERLPDSVEWTCTEVLLPELPLVHIGPTTAIIPSGKRRATAKPRAKAARARTKVARAKAPARVERTGKVPNVEAAVYKRPAKEPADRCAVMRTVGSGETTRTFWRAPTYKGTRLIRTFELPIEVASSSSDDEEDSVTAPGGGRVRQTKLRPRATVRMFLSTIPDVRVSVPACDVCRLFVRPSNVSRVVLAFDPSEKIMICATGCRRDRGRGQFCNSLTLSGLRRLSQMSVARKGCHYDVFHTWLHKEAMGLGERIEAKANGLVAEGGEVHTTE